MIDTHCHLDLPAFDPDREEVLLKSRRAGVLQWVVPGIRLADFPRLVACGGGNIHVALGLHPLFLADHPPDAVEQLSVWVKRQSPVAVGEIGLDHMAPPETHAGQRILLDGQLQLAGAMGLPVLLHVRRAHDPVIAMLRQVKGLKGGIVHAYGGSMEQARHYLDMGFCLGFGGVVTREGAHRVRDLARRLPLSAMVLETDAPDLPPVPHLGERNEPCHLPWIAKAIAQLRNMPVERLVEAVDENARLLLGLGKEVA